MIIPMSLSRGRSQNPAAVFPQLTCNIGKRVRCSTPRLCIATCATPSNNPTSALDGFAMNKSMRQEHHGTTELVRWGCQLAVSGADRGFPHGNNRPANHQMTRSVNYEAARRAGARKEIAWSPWVPGRRIIPNSALSCHRSLKNRCSQPRVLPRSGAQK